VARIGRRLTCSSPLTILLPCMLDRMPQTLEAMGAVPEEGLRQVCTWIENTIDFPASLTGNSTRPRIRDGLSEDLDELRRCFDSLDDFLSDIGVQEMNALTSRGLQLDRLHIIFLPRVGYLLVLSHATAIDAAQQVVDGAGEDDVNSRLSASSRASTVSEQSALAEVGLEFVFTTDEHVYFKNERCHELDNELGDISSAIGTSIFLLSSFNVLPVLWTCRRGVGCFPIELYALVVSVFSFLWAS